jgi:hypothetical protein
VNVVESQAGDSRVLKVTGSFADLPAANATWAIRSEVSFQTIIGQ